MSFNELSTPAATLAELVARVRARRLEREWTQAEMAERAGIPFGTYKKFERTGHLGLEAFVRLVAALRMTGTLAGVLAPPPATSIEALAAQTALTPRRRGRRRA